jgi:hypothetical protein
VRLARAANASVLVSGDRDLLEATVTDPLMITPRAFVDQLDAR